MQHADWFLIGIRPQSVCLKARSLELGRESTKEEEPEGGQRR